MLWIQVSEYSSHEDAASVASTGVQMMLRNPFPRATVSAQEVFDPLLIGSLDNGAGLETKLIEKHTSRSRSQALVACSEAVYRLVCCVSKPEQNVVLEEAVEVMALQIDRIRAVQQSSSGDKG